MTEPLWPHPPRRPGGKIKHSWRCSRQVGIGQTTRRSPDGVIVEVNVCLECECDDYTERLLDQLGPTPPDAA